jgi:hypothetical protein
MLLIILVNSRCEPPCIGIPDIKSTSASISTLIVVGLRMYFAGFDSTFLNWILPECSF